MWAAPDGSLIWTWTDRDARDYHDTCTDGLWMSRIADAGAFSAPSAPRCVAHGVMLGNPVEFSDGSWGLPVCAWYSRTSSGLYVSTDRGTTWHWRGGARIPNYENREFDEHNIVELKDGRYWCVSRMRGDKGGIGQAFSKDKGVTWTPVEPFAVKNVNARSAVMRLKSGNLLLVKNGPIDKDVGRKELTAYLSDDEGATWKGGLLLDARRGATYPNGGQHPDGRIFLVHDQDRYGIQNVVLDIFTEADVLAGKIVSPKSKLGGLVTVQPSAANRAATWPWAARRTRD